MKILPINNGYYNIKSINNQIFKTRIEEFDGNYAVKTNADILEFEGKKYIVGEGEINLNPDKTTNNFTKICILNMLARFTDDKEQFKVLLTAPPLMFNKQKEVLPEYLKGKYKVKHNGKEKFIEIEDVYVYPETIMAYLSNNPEEYKNKFLLVIDVGGLTTNGWLIKNGNFAKDDIFTVQNGMYHLDYQISQYLNGKHYLNTNPEDIENFRKNGLYVKDGKYDIMNLEKENINKFYKKHVEKILKQCMLKQWDINTVSVLVTGGGGSILYETIKEYIPHAKLSKNPVFDNLNGLVVMAKQIQQQIEGLLKKNKK